MNNTFNDAIIARLSEGGVTPEQIDTALHYLLAVYFDLKVPAGIGNEDLMRKINYLRIVERDYSRNTKYGQQAPVKWNIPLFTEATATPDNRWAWTEQYREMFKSIRDDRAGDSKGVRDKMRKFFAANPDVRKEDVMKAALLYINGFKLGTQDPKFFIDAGNFINKVDGKVTVSKLSAMIEQVRNDEAEQKTATTNRFNQRMR